MQHATIVLVYCKGKGSAQCSPTVVNCITNFIVGVMVDSVLVITHT